MEHILIGDEPLGLGKRQRLAPQFPKSGYLDLALEGVPLTWELQASG